MWIDDWAKMGIKNVVIEREREFVGDQMWQKGVQKERGKWEWGKESDSVSCGNKPQLGRQPPRTPQNIANALHNVTIYDISLCILDFTTYTRAPQINQFNHTYHY